MDEYQTEAERLEVLAIKTARAGECKETCRCPLITTEELALWLGKPVRVVRDWRYTIPRRGPDPVRLEAGNVRYRPCEIVAWLDSQAVKK